MNLKIKTGTVGYNNKILVSDGKFSLGKNIEVNAPAMKSTQTVDSHYMLVPRTPLCGAQVPIITHKNQEPQTITPQNGAPLGPHIGHNDEKIALVLFLASGFAT